MSKKLIALTTVALLACLTVPAIAADDDDDKKPKYTTKQVMGKVMKKGTLMEKVATGKASDEDKKMLHEMLVALGKNTPKKGEADSWKELTGKLVTAAKGVVEGKDGAVADLKKAANCKACHSKHK